jgi:tetratricopeptide (TPR) repeat protein
MADALGDHSTDEHNRAVLDLADRLATLIEPTPRLGTIRAHALNNIASDLTNRGKTDEAEMFWLEVLAIREGLARAAPDDKIARYELAKCLTNYANQLLRTDRENQAFQHRERAANLFDALREDARFRATYVPLMVDTDLLLALEYGKRADLARALDRLNKAIDLNAVLLARDPSVARVRGTQADAHTRRAELRERGGEHASAARDYRSAIEFSTKQPHREYCSTRLVQALTRAGELSEAVALASKLNPDTFRHPIPCLELARAWVLIARRTGEDVGLPLREQEETIAAAIRNARIAALTAQKKGLFQTSQEIRAFHAEKELQPIWDVFPRPAD